jgi:hypothetical protein
MKTLTASRAVEALGRLLRTERNINFGIDMGTGVEYLLPAKGQVGV